MKYVITGIVLLFVSVIPAQQPQVGHAGALKNFMHKGDISAKFPLSGLQGRDHVFALGALENLKGEIQIFDSRPLVTYAESGVVQFDSSFARNAALIVYTQVAEWRDSSVPDSVRSMQQLETHVRATATEHGLDPEKPVPFLLSGSVASLDWHVIDWDPADTVHTHKKHQTSGPHGRIETTDVLVLGFYSNKHRAVFTHHSSDLHMHFKKADQTLAGHVDELELAPGMQLHLPANDQ
jgi:acetolactate decarboxylase